MRSLLSRAPVFAVATALLSSTGCFGIVYGSGDSSSEMRSLTGFEGVRTYGQIDVQVTMVDPALAGETVRVVCDDNLLDFIETEIEDGILAIEVQDGLALRTRTRCRVEVEAVDIREVRSSGSGDVEVVGPVLGLQTVRTSGSGDIHIDTASGEILELRTSGSGTLEVMNITMHSVSLDASGSGDIRVSGICNEATLETNGSADLAARDLVTAHALLRTSGSGDVEITATASIDATSSGSGDVDVWGNPPDARLDSTGSGEIVMR